MGEFPLIPLLQRLYQPFVSIEEVISHLGFQVGEQTSPPKDQYQLSCVLLFRYRLQEYLRGIGHPPSSQGELVTREKWDKEKDDPLVRGRLLMDAAWALPRPPADPLWDIKVSLVFA